MKKNDININSNSGANKLAILGGSPVISNLMRPAAPPPYVDEKMVEAIVKTTKSGIWCRIQSATGTVATFEKEYAKLIGTKHCVTTGAGTQALSTCVEALGIGAGDEVITSPYTDIGTVSAVLFSRALPVFADLDRESFQLDPADVERRITENTKAIMPVHIAGNPANLEKIMAIAKKHNLVVIEDACQAHLTEYQGKKLGTIGDIAGFSFQASKNIACGEGGAVVSNNTELMDKVYTVMNHGTSRRGKHELIGPKYRMNEFEGALLLAQLEGVQERHDKRNENCWYMRGKLRDFPGVVPQKLYEGTGSSSWWLFLNAYRKEHFNNVPRATFIKALSAEGVSAGGYIGSGFHKSEVINNHILDLGVYKKMYSPARLKKYRDELPCPNCDDVCDELVLSLGVAAAPGKEYLDKIYDAIIKVYENRDKLRSL
jgi:dTDP-4-amino-4,6-dideoxygalactose transaminase